MKNMLLRGRHIYADTIVQHLPDMALRRTRALVWDDLTDVGLMSRVIMSQRQTLQVSDHRPAAPTPQRFRTPTAGTLGWSFGTNDHDFTSTFIGVQHRCEDAITMGAVEHRDLLAIACVSRCP
jgi:hypothetical protein